MRSANPVEFWPSPSWERYNIYNFGGRIPLLATAGSSVNLYQLREVYPRAQAVMNGIKIRFESIGCDLESALCRLVDLLSERISRCAPAEVPRQHQLCVALNGDKAISSPRVGSSLTLRFCLQPT